MTDQQIEIIITSNTDELSARAVHDCFVNFVGAELEGGEIFLKALVPRRTDDLFSHVGHTGPDDMGLEIEGAVGIPEIHKLGESDPSSAKYPAFADEGTGIFAEHGTIFPKEKQFMYIPPNRGFPGFLSSSKGQEGQHFFATTFALMIASLQINGEKMKAELTARLKSDQMT